MHTAGSKWIAEQAQELMQQFAALGYIEDPSADKEKQAESAEIEAKYNLARTLYVEKPAGKSAAVAGGNRSPPTLGKIGSSSTGGLLF